MQYHFILKHFSKCFHHKQTNKEQRSSNRKKLLSSYFSKLKLEVLPSQTTPKIKIKNPHNKERISVGAIETRPEDPSQVMLTAKLQCVTEVWKLSPSRVAPTTGLTGEPLM